MKKILSLLIVISLIFVICTPAFAEEFQTKDLYGEKYYITDGDGEKRVRFTYNVENGEATINGVHVYKGSAVDLVFPAEIEGYPVKSVENVTMEREDEVTYEEDGATFTNNANMRVKSVTFENGIESLSRVNFTECRELENVYIPDSVKEIDKVWFSHCPKVGAVHMPETAARCDISFERCYAIEQLRFPKGIKEIPEYCCFMCTSLESVTLPEGLEVIGKRAFNSCIVLDSINVSNSVKAIGDYAFCGCKALKSIRLPKHLEEINEGVFAGSGITAIELPMSIKAIGVKAFKETAIDEVKIPSSVKRIDRNAFGMCGNLSSLTISANTKPEMYAFSGCHNLSDVTVDGSMTREIFEAMLGTNVNEAAPCVRKYYDEYDGDFVIFDGNYLAKYKGTDRNPVIPEGITELGGQAFHGADIDSVTFPSAEIKEIPSHCFQGSKIKELTIPSTVKNIRDYAFYGCYNLEKLTIESGVKSVSDNAFMNCSSLTEENVSIAKSVHVGKEAFKQTPLDKEWMDGQEPVETETPKSIPKSEKTPSPEPAVPSVPKTLEVNGNDMTIKIDDNAVDFPDAQPFIDDNDRTQVPIRAVAEMLDGKVAWGDESRTAEITNKNGDIVTLTIDSDIMTVNGENVKMDTAAIIKDDRTYIPVRFVAEALGLTVKWQVK